MSNTVFNVFSMFRPIVQSQDEWCSMCPLQEQTKDDCHFCIYTVSQKKTVKIVFIITVSNLIIFGMKMAKTMKLCKVHSLSISSNLCQCTTVWNIHVPNCCITLSYFPRKCCNDLIKHKIILSVNYLQNYKFACKSSEFMSKVGPTYKDNGLDAMPLTYSGIIDWLIKWHSLIDQKFLSLSVSYFVVCYFHHKIFNITNLLNHVAPSVELMMQRWTIWCS